MAATLNRVISAGFLLFLICGQLSAEPAKSLRAPANSDGIESIDAESIDDILVKARQFYQQKDYLQAKQYFTYALQKSEDKGDVSASLYYNLGSVCYKLEQYEQSRSYFEKLQDNKKLNAIALYNIALIENRQGDKEATIDTLRQSRSITEDPQLVALIDKQLKKLVKQKPVRRKKISYKDWHAYLYLSYGYDSNISFAPLEVASNESGSFGQFIGVFDKVIVGKGAGAKQHALLFTSSVFLSNYFSTDFNDYNLFDVGLRYAFPVSQWRNKLDMNLKKSTYGHEDYQGITSVTYKTRRHFSNRNVFNLRYRYEQIESLDTRFDYLEGQRQRFWLGYQWIWPRDAVQLWYQLELNDRENTATRNYSPTRNTLRLRYEKDLDSTNRIYGEYEYRHSQYDPTPVQDRQDDRSSFLLAYVNDIAPGWQLSAKWRFRSNRSSDEIYSYDRHIAMLTLRKLF